MRNLALRSLAALAVSCGAFVFCPGEVFAQRDLRVPGRTGVKTRPNESPSEKQRAEGQGQGRAATRSVNRAIFFPRAAMALRSDADTLIREFEAARPLYNKLKPEHFVAARLLESYAREIPGAQVSTEDLIRGLAKNKKYRTTLKAKGFTGGQVNELMGRLERQMNALDQ